MKEVVWVFGTSASGKETFIRNIVNNLKQFGWENKSVSLCTSSLENIAQFDDDPIVNLREGIVDETRQLLESSDVVLIKWQLSDSNALLPQKIKQLLPGARHRIVKLEVPLDELMSRLAARAWWHDYGDERRFVETELGVVAGAIEKLQSEFMVSVVDGSNRGAYRLLS